MNPASGKTKLGLPWASPVRRPVFFAGAALTAATLLTYAATFRVPFLFDDRPKIIDNPSLRAWRHLGEILSGQAVTLVGRPLLSFTFALNYAAGREQVGGYHAVNLLIHLLAGLTLFGIVRRSLLSPPLRARWGEAALPLGALIAALWSLHPLLTEAVTYISQRAESLMGLFYLLTLYGFIRGVERVVPNALVWPATSPSASGTTRSTPDGGDPRWFSLSFLACLSGVATKETMVTAPLLVLFYDRTFVAGSFPRALRARRGYYLGLFSSWLFLGGLLWRAGLESRGVGFHVGVTAGTYGLTELTAVAHYLRLSFWPHPLIFDYGSEALVTRFREWAPSALSVGALALASVWAWRRSRPLGFLAGSFFLLLLPTSSLIPIALQPIAESRLYLPLASLMTLVGVAAYAWGGRRAFPGLAIAAAALAVVSVCRNADYQSALRLWEDTVAKQPSSSRAQCSLAVELAKIPGRTPDALAHYEEALRIRPDLAEAHYGLAFALAKMPGRLPEALGHYEAALRIDPDFAEAHNSLGVELARMPDRIPEAVAHLEAAVRIKPDDADAHDNLANVLARIPGRMPEALRHYEQALAIEPGNSRFHTNLANKLAKMPDRVPEALVHYELALRFDPNLAEAHFGWAAALAKIPGRLPEAIAHYEAALRLNPNYAEAHNNLAVAYASLGKTDEAIRHWKLALKINPAYRDARSNLEQFQGPR